MKSRAWIYAQRKDGKYPVLLVYPTSGNRLNKIMTRERAVELITSGRYEIMTAPLELVEQN